MLLPETFVHFPPPDPMVALYVVQACTYAAIAMMLDGTHGHWRLVLCHWFVATVYLAFAGLHVLHF